MGTDLTLFIMHVEDEFRIAIPDGVSDAIRTAGDLHRAVLRSLNNHLQFGGTSPTANDDVWAKLVAMIREQAGSPQLDVSVTTDLTSVIPISGDF
jgi:hypothetical protein